MEQHFSKIKRRILKYLDFKGISKRKFYLESGVANGVLDKTTGLTEDNIDKCLRSYPDLNPTWLLTGDGEMLKIENKTAEKHLSGYPLLPFEAFGGNGDDFSKGVNFSTIEDRYVVPLFDGLHVDFMIPVRGSSMYPKYNSGDVVACRIIKELLYVQWNKTYVIDTFSQGTILKRLKKADDDKAVICKSDNKDYDEFELPKKDIRNIALVVGVIRLE